MLCDTQSPAKPVRVGILHSLSGTLAWSETNLKDAALMAIAEINEQGGVLGRPIQAVIEDGDSDHEVFVQKAKKLIQVDRVKSVFGCWSSATRKAVKPLFESCNALLWYPLQYEGLEESPNIFYSGLCPNQQVEPAVAWLLENCGSRFYLIGSDYVFPRTVHKLVEAQVKRLGGSVVGVDYLPLGSQDFEATFERILQAQPDVLFNSLNGDSNPAFYQRYRDAGFDPAILAVLAVSVAEPELSQMGAIAAGTYASWSYFQTGDSRENQEFVANFQRRYGGDRVTSDPIEAAYTQVYLWKQAVESAGSFEVNAVRKAAYGQMRVGPSGPVRLGRNHHLSKPCRIGQVQANGQFTTVWSSESLILPQPWLGAESLKFRNAELLKALLSEVPQGIQYNWVLEQHSRQLEESNAQLLAETEMRKLAQEALAQANSQVQTLNQQLRSENRRMEAELDITRRLQQMILPKPTELSQITCLDIAGFMEPAEEIGGDYYDVLPFEGGVKISIGDITGHGLESGMLMLMVQTAVRTLQISGEQDPKRFLNILNQIIYENVQRMNCDRNLTLSMIDYLGKGQICLSGQHEEMIVVRHSGLIERIDTIDLGFPIGLEPDIDAFVSQRKVQLNPGDGVVLYTDGITEAENDQGELYGVQRLCGVASQHWHESAATIQGAVIADVRSHIGTHRVYDDITLVVVKQR
jgi:urea ABC transporter urea binding protein